ncbi:WD40 repeat-like protein [Coprinopsis marcescibilis]|uniref:WD40 repeat-like protein n=1 Tax=Coprinopsis marcescibilis TaxID=230819 RepID=A0A5C3KWD6_COPMA|nr:WD40 repeat-like protein [Coprinopsis marcescibilis]
MSRNLDLRNPLYALPNQLRCINSRKGQSSVESIIANGLPYSRRLHSHTSCVNALAFSSGDGRFLASGGDDLRLRLWDTHQDDLTQPSINLHGATGNIFTIAFSAQNRYIYSGGVCEAVFRYDISTLGETPVSQSPQASHFDQEGSIRSVSCHPFNEDIVLSASEDGTVVRYDARDSDTRTRRWRRDASESNTSALRLKVELASALYHPTISHLFLTADTRGKVCLRDERMIFGNSSREENGGIVRTYNTKLTKRSVQHLSNPEVSSVAFDQDGSRFALTLQHYLPTIYATEDPHPIAVCSGKIWPNGEPVTPGQKSYSNACTMKHGSFGSLGTNSDQYYGAGSDDFCAYLWKIPSISELKDQRKEINPLDWWTKETSDTTAFTDGFSQPKFIPVDLSRPHCRLTGHISIVNSVEFHPQFLHVATSGVEKDIILHSPTPGSPCTRDLEPTPTEVRALPDNNEEDRLSYFRALFGAFSEADRDENRTISMFDYIVRQEGDRNIFEIRKWRPDPADNEDEEPDPDDDSTDANSSSEDDTTYS